ncbi:myo-inositol-1(or 4)-monophosphatase/deoxyribonuclease-2 [Cryobacterium flavum]|uniref:Myo-inositol-1(Or 4)-monophosphatase/deoxyribonuclease-2 n=1 Tax=Cryobacterium flavum TaxID=1424659 RepID=A0A5E9G279_9MICO|nr:MULTISPECIES: inositol monophosphatase family protein [Cryobacterium]SDO25755.1 myo-inositol-1(or 4)-monophosphatase/deoxyribonuclease-2 [Cryobacterium flavum]
MSAPSAAAQRVAAVTAHRGDSQNFRENTLAAIRSAIAAGADYVEVDVRVTRDGQVVLLHDASLVRLWGFDAAISDLTYAQVALLGGDDLRVPLLRDALKLFEDFPTLLLIDMDEEAPAAPAFEVVRESGLDVAWCGSLAGMRRIRSLDAQARIWLPWDRREVPPLELIDELRPEFVNAEYVVLSRKLVDDIHALGLGVACWTVDSAAIMRWVLALGVDSVTSNRLALLAETVREAVGPEPAAFSAVSAFSADELREASAIARELAIWAQDYSRSADRGTISTKANPGDLVTEVDVAVERHVRARIAATFPSHNFVGEEMGGEAQAGVPCWYLDPVDGTTNYANLIPWTSFSLALAVDHVPYVAVVSEPWRGDLFEAVAGQGARLNGAALALPRAGEGPLSLAGRVVHTELAGHLPWPGMIELLTALGERFSIMRVMGSATLTVVGIAAGRGAASVIGQFSAVDHLAGTLIVQEAGGVVLDEDGIPNAFPQHGGILVAAPEAATEVYGLWRAAVGAR